MPSFLLHVRDPYLDGNLVLFYSSQPADAAAIVVPCQAMLVEGPKHLCTHTAVAGETWRTPHQHPHSPTAHPLVCSSRRHVPVDPSMVFNKLREIVEESSACGLVSVCTLQHEHKGPMVAGTTVLTAAPRVPFKTLF